MSMHMIDNYKYLTMQDPKPAWMRNERYEYCESYVSGAMTKKARRRRIPLFSSVMTMLFHI